MALLQVVEVPTSNHPGWPTSRYNTNPATYGHKYTGYSCYDNFDIAPYNANHYFYACFTNCIANRFDILDNCRVYGSKY